MTRPAREKKPPYPVSSLLLVLDGLTFSIETEGFTAFGAVPLGRPGRRLLQTHALEMEPFFGAL